MGSHAEEFPLKDDEITVLVTGFAPFRTQYPVNPAWEIAKALPPFLPPTKFSHGQISAISRLPPVRILVHPEAVRVSYPVVRKLVPNLWAGQKIDYAVHIGMASGRKFYSVERRGHRDGYGMKDVDNSYLGDSERRKVEGDKWIWDGMPEELLTSINVDDVWTRWRAAVPHIDVRVSEDAGRYLCDFIFYSSLAHLTKTGEDRRVVFFHVPVNASDESVQIGIEACIELIRSIVISGELTKKMTAVLPSDITATS